MLGWQLMHLCLRLQHCRKWTVGTSSSNQPTTIIISTTNRQQHQQPLQRWQASEYLAGEGFGRFDLR